MSFTRKFLICSTLEHAALLDGIALQYVLAGNENGANEWSGVYVRDDGAYGVEWEAPLTGLLGPIIDEDTKQVLLPVVTEIKDKDSVSDWQRLPSPSPESPLLP